MVSNDLFAGKCLICELILALVDNWVVGKEKVCYWLSNDIVGLVGNLAV